MTTEAISFINNYFYILYDIVIEVSYMRVSYFTSTLIQETQYFPGEKVF